MWNEIREVEYCMGDLGEDEDVASLLWDHELRPRSNGRTFEAKVAGTGYEHSVASRWLWRT